MVLHSCHWVKSYSQVQYSCGFGCVHHFDACFHTSFSGCLSLRNLARAQTIPDFCRTGSWLLVADLLFYIRQLGHFGQENWRMTPITFGLTFGLTKSSSRKAQLVLVYSKRFVGQVLLAVSGCKALKLWKSSGLFHKSLAQWLRGEKVRAKSAISSEQKLGGFRHKSASLKLLTCKKNPPFRLCGF